ncbi:MAG: hypothetical protein KatS3mg016_1050 [Fimbriimonadales bacterium]|nr:MAG: hypothetical protein KatS3mg016_1050 [Fimbriimonadales bacterium]
MRLHKLVLTLTASAVMIAAYAAGWDVTAINSSGVLNPGSVLTNVPVNINGTTVNAPATVNVLTTPQVTFLTNAGNPAPILVGNGTSYTNGTFTGVYEVKSMGGGALTGFNFVLSGFVFEYGQIIFFKKVVDYNTSEVLFTGSWTWSGSAYGGTDGPVSLNQSFSLSSPSSHFLVFEVAILHIDGAPAPGTSTASLQLIEQDWVPEPASLIALATGLGALVLRRRKQ